MSSTAIPAGDKDVVALAVDTIGHEIARVDRADIPIAKTPASQAATRNAARPAWR